MEVGDAASWATAVVTIGALGFTAYTVRLRSIVNGELMTISVAYMRGE
jgi:hypothetical protein